MSPVLHDVADPSLVSPDTWQHGAAPVSRAGNDEVQLALFRDYASNRALYPSLHEFLRTSGVPVLVVWGRPTASRPREPRPAPGAAWPCRPRATIPRPWSS